MKPAYPAPHNICSYTISEYRYKRGFDFVVASLALGISLPLCFIVGAAIKLEDRGPILYRQKRWGKNKAVIDVYKFRTMVVDAEERFGRIQARENDARVTRVGKWLRATSLDEMPQLLSIWKGDMSWVGPRALPIDEVQIKEESGYAPDSAIPGFEHRCRVRPGLTGIAQVYAPRDAPRRHKFRYDLIYVLNQSVWLDLKLIALSLWITVRASWERRSRKF